MKIIYEPAGRAREYSPLAVNLYLGCSHDCYYCYGRKFRKGSIFRFGEVRKNIIDLLKKDLEQPLEKAYPILLCFLCDPYQEIALGDGGVTREAIKVIKSSEYQVQILSKAGMQATRDFDLLDSGDFVAATLTFVTPEKSLKAEPGAALPESRFAYLKEAHKKGYNTWVSLEPVIEVEETLKVIDATKDYVDLYRLGILNYYSPPIPIDWVEYGKKVIEKLEKYGKNYRLKHDLKNKLVGHNIRYNEFEFESIKTAKEIKNVQKELFNG